MTDRRDQALETIRDAVHGAELVQFPNTRARDGPEPKGRRSRKAPAPDDRGDDGQGVPLNEYGLPDGCPIVPLGKEGQTYYYLDALDQLVALKARDHGRNNLMSLFAPWIELATVLWPRLKAGKGGALIVVGFRPEACADALMDACARMGVWNPVEKVRGLGAWTDGDGGLVLHCGRSLWTEQGQLRTGLVDGHVYASAPPIPDPWPEPVRAADANGPAARVLDALKTWNWARGKGAVDATLMLGWIGAAMLGGALDWRPMVFVTGDKASGKSTLHTMLKHLFDGGIIQAGDTTAAGLYQHIKHSALPVAIDELEAEADNKRTQSVIRLARLASSGAVMLRGGAEHTGVEFKARSCFLFSAILMPPLTPQDRSRMAILALDRLGDTPPPSLEPRAWREIGRKLRRRLCDQWPRFAETLRLYTVALAEVGHDARACDQFGALLACADLLLFDMEPESEALIGWQEWLAPTLLRETAENQSDAEACLDWLCQSRPEDWRGGTKKTVAELVEAAAHVNAGYSGESADYAKQSLAAGGLAVTLSGGKPYLAVPCKHRQVGELFKTSRWAGEAGIEGVWAQALARLEGVIRSRNVKINGRSTRCCCVPVSAVVTQVPRAEVEAADA